VFGAGKARILCAVDKTGSINAAARELGMSYRHAWSTIDAAEHRLGHKLLRRSRGGPKGGGATLTRYARDLLDKLNALEEEVKNTADKRFARLFGQKPKGIEG